MRPSYVFAAMVLLSGCDLADGQILQDGNQDADGALKPVCKHGRCPVDAGSVIDAGRVVDAGSFVDAGQTVDAGAPADAGSPVDAGTPPTRVTSVTALLAALADDSITDIVVANGTYRISTAASQRADSLWIGARFASRTNPVTVRAETAGGVTFDGAGASYFGGITFVEGAHHQTWDGFVFANGIPTMTGVIVFGGYAGLAAPHHITLRNITIPRSVTSTSTGTTDHSVYFSEAVGGPHDLLIDGFDVDGAGGVDSAIHFYHSDANNLNAWNVTIRNMRVTGTHEAVVLWDQTIRNIVIEDSTVTGADDTAIRYEQGGTVTLTRVTTIGSRSYGFYSSLGASPPGVTFNGCSLH